MCNKCGQTYSSTNIAQKILERRQKDQEAQVMLQMGFNMLGSLFDIVSSFCEEEGSTSRTTAEAPDVSDEAEDTPVNTTVLQEEVENILGKKEFNKLPADLQEDILKKYDAYKNVLKLKGDPLNERVKNYVKALQAHQIELRMGDFSKDVFNEALKKVAKDPKAPTDEELNEALELTLKMKQECKIKIADSDIKVENLQNDENFNSYLSALKTRGQGYVDMYDKNNDQKISFEEFKALEEKDFGKALTKQEIENTRKFFNRIDRDNNGIDANEMASHLYTISRMNDDSSTNTASDITFGEWNDSQMILTNEIVSERYNSIYNQLYGVLKPRE